MKDDLIKRAEYLSHISFDHEDIICIKKEIKQEIRNEPLESDEVHEGLKLNDDDVFYIAPLIVNKGTYIRIYYSHRSNK